MRTGHIHLRESDQPHETATATPHALSGLLDAVKGDVIGSGSR